MKARKWTAQQKFQIVLEGIKGTSSLAELCNRHQVSQNQYYKWRDRFLNDAPKVFEYGGIDRTEERLLSENRKLKQAVGELTMELKKNEF